jgi:CubicO group peptidase (beta-lactamase class C family)
VIELTRLYPGLFVGLVLGCGQSAEREPRAAGSFAAVLDTLVPSLLARHEAPGAEVALIERGRAVATRGYGLADRARQTPMTDSTPIGVASISKLVSTWGVMHLAQAGKLPLDAPIETLLVRWSLPHSKFDPGGVTPRRLLSHTAGLGMLSVPCFPADSTRPSIESVLDGKAGDRGRVELHREPGTAWSYSGGGFTVLELAVTERSGMSFAEYFRTTVFAPLGMTETGFDASPGRRAIAEGYDEAGDRVHPSRCVGTAAAGLVTSARDMAKLLAEYSRVKAGRSRVLTAGTLTSIATPLIKTSLEIQGRTIDMGDTQMGLGHFIHRTSDGHTILFHSGGNPGVGAYFVIDIDRGNGLFVVVNSDHAGKVMREVLASWAAWYRSDPPTFF